MYKICICLQDKFASLSNSLTINNGRVGLQRMDSFHTAHAGPVRIQFKCLVLIYVFPEMKL